MASKKAWMGYYQATPVGGPAVTMVYPRFLFSNNFRSSQLYLFFFLFVSFNLLYTLA